MSFVDFQAYIRAVSSLPYTADGNTRVHVLYDAV